MSQGSRYCHKCGTALPAGALFCPNCGTAVGAPSAGQVQAQAPAQAAPRYEKHEKQEKREKGEKQEKRRGGDLASAITGGLILILLGFLLYYAALGSTAITFGNFWEYFIIGVGVILLIQGIIRYGERGTHYFGSFFGGALMIIIGLVFVSSANVNLWPLILVVLGIAAIISAITGRRRSPAP